MQSLCLESMRLLNYFNWTVCAPHFSLPPFTILSFSKEKYFKEKQICPLLFFLQIWLCHFMADSVLTDFLFLAINFITFLSIKVNWVTTKTCFLNLLLHTTAQCNSLITITFQLCVFCLQM